jgi:hypothetical protein
MAKDGAKPVALPYVDDDDLAELAVDMGAGWFTAASLYDWYVLMIEPAGRQPVSKKRFGMELAARNWHSSLRTVDARKQARCWLVNKPWVRRGEALLAADKS